MNPDWQSFLEQQGARIEAGVVASFGNAQKELESAASKAVMADLSQLGILEFSGADAEAFLHGQLTCDVQAIAPGGASLGAYCTAKGRMLADFFLVRDADRFLMLLPRELVEPVQKRLRMFVLRSRVEIRAASDDWVLLGIAGDAALPDGAAAVALFDIPERRRIAVMSPQSAIAAWPVLAGRLKPVGRAAWEWLDIRHGLPLIVPQTQDQLVPQMANLELIGGVSFRKGCYPGQEIVARSQYLGKVKRRMFLASVPGDAGPRPGDPLYSEELGDQASGLVVAAQRAPNGDYDLLAVAQLASREAGSVRLGSPQGPLLRFTDLPYEVKS